MRYIGNKTKLLPFLRSALRRLGIPRGTAHDAFAGTASVGRALKADGWRVSSSDIMTYSYVMQRAYIVASRVGEFDRLARADSGVRAALAAHSRPLEAVAAHLSCGLEPADGFITRHFAPSGGRMYFTDENARRIDAARTALHAWQSNALIGDDAFYVLLAAVIEGADRVANTAGVYAAFIKRWQPNALRPFVAMPLPPVPSRARCVAHKADAVEVARALGPIDLLYVDPPYNTRQYAGYYHIPEVIARGWFNGAVAVRGKTGLIADGEQRSAWCSRRRAPGALRELLAATGARHVLVSYNTEGVIPDAEFRAILRGAAVDGRVRRFTRTYKRYRADRDREGRRYRGDEVKELLYYARLR
ncbi:MAG TPA: DNA adenine methylase [Gemmatimonadaceae bacterium]|jgi:adenine-specific DNA-methyltransferase|nr:DNA adenine methylase [Gemmatimonadaceae bacterium]